MKTTVASGARIRANEKRPAIGRSAYRESAYVGLWTRKTWSARPIARARCGAHDFFGATSALAEGGALGAEQARCLIEDSAELMGTAPCQHLAGASDDGVREGIVNAPAASAAAADSSNPDPLP